MAGKFGFRKHASSVASSFASPRQLNPGIPIDLETICLKCLEKPIHRRYSSAGELAANLGRYLASRPILARPVRTHERFWKWCRRNPIVTTLLATVTASLVIGTVVSTYFAIEAQDPALAGASRSMISFWLSRTPRF